MLKEHRAIRGIALPGMPVGAPGHARSKVEAAKRLHAGFEFAAPSLRELLKCRGRCCSHEVGHHNVASRPLERPHVCFCSERPWARRGGMGFFVPAGHPNCDFAKDRVRGSHQGCGRAVALAYQASRIHTRAERVIKRRLAKSSVESVLS
ncbi:hypothetical protein [Cupriavidus basilensis]